MENLQAEMKSSGHTLSSAPFMRLSRPPSSPVKGRAYENFGTSFGPSNSQKSTSSNGSKMKKGLTPLDRKDEDIWGGFNDSPDEMDLLSSPYRSPDKRKVKSVTGQDEEIPEYIRTSVIPKGLNFKRNKAQDPDATPKPNRSTKTTSSQESSHPGPSKPSNCAGAPTTAKGLGASPDENVRKRTKSKKTVGPPALGMIGRRTVRNSVAKDVFGPHTANVQESQPSGSDDEGVGAALQVKGKGSRPKPKPANRGKRSKQRPLSSPCLPSVSESENTSDGANTSKQKRKTKPRSKPAAQEFPGVSLSPVSDREVKKNGKGKAQAFPMEGVTPPRRKERRQPEGFPVSGTPPPGVFLSLVSDREVKKNGKGKAQAFPMEGVTPPRRKARRQPEDFPMNGTPPPRVGARKKNKGKEKQQPCDFPVSSPLREESPTSTQDAFPDFSPLLAPAHTMEEPPWLEDIGGGHDDEDGTSKRALQPFPMGTQVLASISRDDDMLHTPQSHAVKRLSEGDNVDEGSAMKRHRTNRNTDGTTSHDVIQPDISQVDIDNLFLDPSVDPMTLCPWCDGPLPAHPTPHLASLIAATRRKSYKQPRPSNPLGLKAPLSVFSSVCQRHRFETIQVPLARAKGWPTNIDFGALRRRVEGMKDMLQEIIDDGDRDLYETDLDEMDEEDVRALGPRWQVVFWMDVVKDVQKKGSRVVGSLKNQFGSFEKTQPGYYGEMGSLIIQQTLYTMFPPATFDPKLIAPLNPTEFIQRILVPQVGVALIMDDMHLDVAGAVDTLRESAQYGVAMYPGDDDTGAGEEIVKERAAARRKELEEEEKAEEELMQKMSEVESMDDVRSGASKRGAKQKRRDAKATVTESTKCQYHYVAQQEETRCGN
ncbi:hypothetical protein NEOLEDRAFT_793259 [Neolentinus lepideus HHB14362 ss-1]|uniref:Restriction of telomere capping protein 4 n=1 Tax=Neolentinus lepideus HHB14362 ss-1 TaxID=1314782 RepID=A0A165PL61_9AGAM|nr:hypothetical protein NEOLEDRAFT_793259 [Neolentinus lepideus HHB14362 ss-1]